MKDEHVPTSHQEETKLATASVVTASTMAAKKSFARLPCRGCLASCKNYARCDGKLWRLER